MTSDDEGSISAADLETSESEPQFIPQEDDEETLWQVIEIIAEKGNKYKVRWAGVDPKTGKAWDPDWVTKPNVTSDLVKEWKLKKAKKKKSKGSGRRQSTKSSTSKTARPSEVSRASMGSKISTNSSSTVRKTRTSTAAQGQDPDVWDSPPKAGPSRKPAKRKISAISDPDDLPNNATPPNSPPPQHTAKKRKVALAPPSSESEDDAPPSKVSSAKTNGKAPSRKVHVKPEEHEEEEEQEEGYRSPSPLPKPARPKVKVNGKVAQASATSGSGTRSDSRRSTAMPKSKQTEVGKGKGKGKVPSPPPHSGGNSGDASDAELAELPYAPQQDSGAQQQSATPPPIRQPITMLPFSSPVLSPKGKARLQEFDDFLLAEQMESDNARSDIQPNRDLVPAPADDIGPDDVPDVAIPLFLPDHSEEDDYPYRGQREDSSPKVPAAAITLPRPEVALKKAGSIPRLRHPPDDSYRTDIVPETEAESSNNTQSQSQSQSQGLPLTPQRNSLVSKMKPRTPRTGSKASLGRNDSEILMNGNGFPNGNGRNARKNSKPLRPIPVVSPSTFTPHLPPPKSLPSDDADHDETIEQWSSPEKGPSQRQRRRAPRPRVLDEEDEEGEERTRERGIAMAEAARRERIRKERGEEPKKKPLNLLVNGTGKQVQDPQSSHEPISEFSRDVVPQSQTIEEMEAGDADTEEEEEVKTDLEDDEGSPEPEPDRDPSVALRQEEEENTQDILNELHAFPNLQDDMDLDLGLEAQPADTHDGSQDVSMPDQTDDGNDADESFNDLAYPSEGLSASKDMDAVVSTHNPAESTRSKTKSKSLVNGALELKERLEDGEVPQTASTPRDSPQPSASKYVPTRDDSRLDHALSLLNSKSEEIKRLQTEVDKQHLRYMALSHDFTSLEGALASAQADSQKLAAAQAELALRKIESSEHHTLSINFAQLQAAKDAAEVERDHFRAQYKQASALVNSADTAGDDRHNQHLKDLDDVTLALEAAEKARDSHLAEATQTSVLLSSAREEISELQKRLQEVDSARLAKESAEKDRDFFREQYGQASGYVSSVREENSELEKRVKIAEGQAKDGVDLIRRTFEGRIKDLEKNVESWRKTANFLILKDEKTNDEIRRRAGEEPELRAHCKALEEALIAQRDEYDTLETEMLEKDTEKEALEVEVEKWKREATKLAAELRAGKTKRERTSGNDADDSGNELVYRCQWRLEGTNEECPEVLPTLEDLQNHLFTAGHL